MSGRPVTIFTLGGTIAMTPAEDGRAVPAIDATALCAAVPDLTRVAAISTVNFRALPGAHLTLDDLLALARAIEAARDGGAAGAVVSQGTDTMEETAFVLNTLLDPEFPVAVTGAMRHPGQPGADGPANLLAAAAVAASTEATGIGTVVVINDEIHAADFVQKTHATQPSAFSSPGVGPIGFITEATPRIAAMPRARARLALAEIGDGSTQVALITIGLGDDGVLARLAGSGGYDGIVVNAMGAGHVPEAAADALGEVAGRLPVVLASRTGGGTVLAATYGFKGSETDLLARGLIRAGWLPGLKARLLLMLCLRAGLERTAIRRAFAQCGGG